MPLRNDAAVRPILAIDTASVGGLIQASRAAALFLVVENKKQTGLPTTPLLLVATAPKSVSDFAKTPSLTEGYGETLLSPTSAP